jgi:hypothetical protein
MPQQANFADADYEPTDEDLQALAQEAFAQVTERHVDALTRLRRRIAELRTEALVRLRETIPTAESEAG